MIRRIDSFHDDGPRRLREALRATGCAVVATPPDLAELAGADPWAFAATLFGEPADLVEKQPIRAIAGGRSFASSAAHAPMHTDSQSMLGVPAHALTMLCARPAERGGESLLVDAWELAERVRARDPELFAALVEAPRRIPFYFGEVRGPTLAKRGGGLAFTHSPVARDPIAARLAPHLAEAPVLEIALGAADALVVDNHRMLHGRRAFEDTRRELVRVLAWLPRPLGAYPDAVLAARVPELAPSPAAPDARARLALVHAMLRGVPPGILAARAGVREELLYAWRDAALRASLDALNSLSSGA